HGWLSPAQQEIFKRVYSKIDNTLSKEILRRFFEIKLPLEVTHKIAEILVLQPNLENGRRLFFDDPSMQCSTCHQVNDVGGVFGPDLSEIGKKYTLNQLLEHILEPSKLVDETYRSVTIEMGIGDILTGIVTENNKQELKFRNANGVEIRLLKSEVEDLQYSQLSAMPEGLLESKTVQETRDLLGFLVEGSAGSF
ncbi:MAG: c-type cytochrome, partial [Crocinitomicaceae bacterium]|nr:c-type cytochrome [Crocinitomicaceae bacterium]